MLSIFVEQLFVDGRLFFEIDCRKIVTLISENCPYTFRVFGYWLDFLHSYENEKDFVGLGQTAELIVKFRLALAPMLKLDHICEYNYELATLILHNLTDIDMKHGYNKGANHQKRRYNYESQFEKGNRRIVQK